MTMAAALHNMPLFAYIRLLRDIRKEYGNDAAVFQVEYDVAVVYERERFAEIEREKRESL